MNLLKRLFSFDSKPEPAKPESISCFVLGLIRSMKETPGEWKRDDDYSDPWWRHPSSGVCVICCSSTWEPCNRMKVVGHKLNRTEALALTDAFLTYLENPAQEEIAKRHLEWQTKEELERAAERVSFEKLGCPDGVNPTN